MVELDDRSLEMSSRWLLPLFILTRAQLAPLFLEMWINEGWPYLGTAFLICHIIIHAMSASWFLPVPVWLHPWEGTTLAHYDTEDEQSYDWLATFHWSCVCSYNRNGWDFGSGRQSLSYANTFTVIWLSIYICCGLWSLLIWLHEIGCSLFQTYTSVYLFAISQMYLT